jgi:hypothetical protein
VKLKRSQVDCLVLEATLDAQPSGNGWRRANCPLCVYYGEPSEDTRQSFGIHDSGSWHCFRCGATGFSGEGSESGLPVESTPDFMEPPEGFVPLASSDGQRSVALAPAREYLTSRGVTLEMLERTGLGACASGFYAGRIVAPVFEPSGKYWLGFMSRVWLGGAALKAAQAQAAKEGERFLKYRYPNWPGRGRVLYNQAALTEKTDQPVLTGEGVFDVIHHLPSAVACLGKPSHDQLTLLLHGLRPVCFVLDGDAWKQARALALWMRLHDKPAGYIRLPPKVDPDEIPPEVLAEAAKRSISDAIEV